MAITETAERNLLRAQVVEKSLELFSAVYDDVMLVKSNKFCFPLVGCEGSELYAEVTISIPKGAKGEPYNGYELAQDYAFKVEEDKRKAAERKAEKERKIKRDEEIRKKKAEIREKVDG